MCECFRRLPMIHIPVYGVIKKMTTKTSDILNTNFGHSWENMVHLGYLKTKSVELFHCSFGDDFYTHKVLPIYFRSMKMETSTTPSCSGPIPTQRII